MEYIELLRVRTALVWYTGILVLLALLVMSAGGNQATVTVNGAARLMPGMEISFGPLTAIAAFCGAIFASSAGMSLNRENATRELSWTKPIARWAIALRYIAVDLAGVLLAYAVALLAILAVATHMHLNPIADAGLPAQLVLGAGVSAMWYALLQALTCALPSGARAVAGLMWPIAFVTAAVSHLPGSIGDAARALDTIDPLHYLGGGALGQASGAAPPEVRALAVWCFTAAFCALSIAVWPRKEA